MLTRQLNSCKLK